MIRSYRLPGHRLSQMQASGVLSAALEVLASYLNGGRQ
jgi:hypothetical protein